MRPGWRVPKFWYSRVLDWGDYCKQKNCSPFSKECSSDNWACSTCANGRVSQYVLRPGSFFDRRRKNKLIKKRSPER